MQQFDLHDLKLDQPKWRYTYYVVILKIKHIKLVASFPENEEQCIQATTKFKYTVFEPT